MKKWLWLGGVVLIAGVIAAAIFLGRDKANTNTSSATPNPAIGVITQVSEESISLKADDGKDFTFTNKATNIPIDHLKEHMEEKEAVSITWHTEGDAKVATSVDDAP